jgi:hypothetical protein
MVSILGRENGARRRGECGLEDSQGSINRHIVPQVLDDGARVGDGRAIPSKQFADLCEAEAERHVRQVHGRLPRENIGIRASSGPSRAEHEDRGIFYDAADVTTIY